MNTRSELVCVWSGAVFVALFMVGFWPLANYLPPILPSASAAEIAAMYQEHTLQIRLGLVLMMLAFALILPFAAVISIQISRMEGLPSVLSYTQLAAGSSNAVLAIIPCLLWTTAAYRPERSAESIQIFNDMAWITFLWPVGTFVVQVVALGLATLGDKNERPICPRWFGFFNLWCAVLFMPGAMLTFFKTGPFAWSGLLVFWLGVVAFFGWYTVTFAVLRASIIRQGQDATA
jgi:hypothetical protein